MNNLAHSFTVASLVVLPALGVGIGQGRVNKAALEAINEQPAVEGALQRLALISLTLSETAVLLGVVMAILILRDPALSMPVSLAYVGIVCGCAIPGFMVGLVSAKPGIAALKAAARQPLFITKITQLLLISQAVIQTSTIFGFIIALFLRNQAASATLLSDGIRLCASGVCFGLACIGPLLGLGYFTQAVCTVAGTNRSIYPRLRTFAFISQALIEAPVVFSLIIALVLAISSSAAPSPSRNAAFIAAALIMGLTTLSTGINSSKTATTTARLLAKYPDQYPTLSKMSMITQTFIDTAAIYGLLDCLIVLWAS